MAEHEDDEGERNDEFRAVLLPKPLDRPVLQVTVGAELKRAEHFRRRADVGRDRPVLPPSIHRHREEFGRHLARDLLRKVFRRRNDPSGIERGRVSAGEAVSDSALEHLDGIGEAVALRAAEILEIAGAHNPGVRTARKHVGDDVAHAKRILGHELAEEVVRIVPPLEQLVLNLQEAGRHFRGDGGNDLALQIVELLDVRSVASHDDGGG